MGSDGIRTLGVAGAGQMGRGIAQVGAQAGCQVLLHDREDGIVRGAIDTVASGLKRQVEKGKTSRADADAIVARLRPATDLAGFAACDFVVEAVNESVRLKSDIFKTLDQVCRPGVILASNTSSLSITRLGACTGRPDRVIGMHFMNPVPVMALVEIIAGQATSKSTVDDTRALAVRMGKTPVVAQDYPGFISNRVLMPMINEAIFALYEGVGSREDIDTVMTLGMRHPMGPLALADFIGLDTCLAILQVLHDGFGDPKYRPCPLLRRMVEAGHLGKKTGHGFYDYGPTGERCST